MNDASRLARFIAKSLARDWWSATFYGYDAFVMLVIVSYALMLRSIDMAALTVVPAFFGVRLMASDWRDYQLEKKSAPEDSGAHLTHQGDR